MDSASKESALAQELWHVFLLLLHYLKMDGVDCVKSPSLKKVATLVMRYALLASLGWGMLPSLMMFVFFAAYFGLLTHSIEPIPSAVGFR